MDTIKKNPKLSIIASIVAVTLGLCGCCTCYGALLGDSKPAAPKAKVAAVESLAEHPEATTAATLPTNTPTPEPTLTNTATTLPTNTPTSEPTLTPTDTQVPTPTVPPSPVIIITAVNAQQEYVDLQNIGSQAQDLTGWHLLSERGSQDCPLAGLIQPGQTLRIWALASAAGQGGINCGFNENIWNNKDDDPAILFNAAGEVVDRKD